MLVTQVEATSTLLRVKLAYDAGIRMIEVEVDCLTLANLLQAKCRESSTTHVIANDICGFVKYFVVCSFNFTRRTCNKVAYVMTSEVVFPSPLRKT